MFVVIVGAGKVGLNVARSLTHMGHEFIVIEQRRSRYDLLRPEQSLGWDAGIEQSFGRGLVRMGLSYFRTDFRNLIDFTNMIGYVNIGRARTDGVEASAQIQPSADLELLIPRRPRRGLPLLPPQGGDRISGRLHPRAQRNAGAAS